MISSNQDMDLEDKKPDNQWSENQGVSRVGLSVLSSISTFSGAKRFIKDFEEALDLANLT